MPHLDGESREPTDARDDRDDAATPDVPIGLVDELPLPHTHTNLASGIVWADILADIAADEEARQLRNAA